MATMRRPADATRFVVRAAAVALGAFGVLSLTWTETYVVLPLTRVLGQAAAALFGAPSMPIEVTLACSGTDAIALCLGAVLAYPVSWPRRLAGAAGGAAVVLALNTTRIGTLGLVAHSPSWFNALHLYVWPAILTLSIAGYVYVWMFAADRVPQDRPTALRQPFTRFAVLTVVFVVLGALMAPLYLQSARVLQAAGLVASAAAWVLTAAGATAHATANVLWTPRGGFLVTQECISTPLVPVYLAAVCAFSPTRRRLGLGLLAAVPLFAALAVARLLAAALPDAVLASPAHFIHAFYQLLLAGVLVAVAAMWRHDGRAAAWRTLAGGVAGIAFVYALGPAYLSAVAPNAALVAADPQGAVTLLPPFQVGLYVALWIAAFTAVEWPRLLAGLGVLALTQAAGLATLQALSLEVGLLPLVPGVRAWAVAGPLVILAGVATIGRAPR